MWVVGKKDQLLEKKDSKKDQKIAKKKTLADQFSQIFGKKQTSTDQVGPKNINAKSDN